MTEGNSKGRQENPDKKGPARQPLEKGEQRRGRSDFELIRVSPDEPAVYSPRTIRRQFFFIELSDEQSAAPGENPSGTWTPSGAYDWLSELRSKNPPAAPRLAVVGTEAQLESHPFSKLGTVPYLAREGWQERLEELMRRPAQQEERREPKDLPPTSPEELQALKEHGRKMSDLGAPDWIQEYEPGERFD